MSDVGEFFDIATLAEASYVLFDKLTDFTDKKVLDALQNNIDFNGNFSATQAANFVAEWEVVSHQPNTDSGFSATLFKNKITGEYVYAARGTEPGNPMADIFYTDLGDIVVDGLAIGQIVDMYNDWQRINTSEGQSYQAARLDLLEDATGLLFAERSVVPGSVAGPYELSLEGKGDGFIC